MGGKGLEIDEAVGRKEERMIKSSTQHPTQNKAFMNLSAMQAGLSG